MQKVLNSPVRGLTEENESFKIGSVKIQKRKKMLQINS